MEFLIKHKAVLCLIAFSLFCIISLSVQTSGFTMSFEGILSMMVMPFQKGYDKMQGGVSTVWTGVTELGDIRKELEHAKEKLREHENILEELSELKKENTKLSTLLGLQAHTPSEYMLCSVISKDPDNWFRTIIINKGSNDGIKVNMPVVVFHEEERAVVGKISEVRGSISRIQPLIATDLRLGVMLRDSGYPGLLTGYASNKDLCIVDYVNKAVSVKQGDVIITSGQGGIFPRGLLVGTVEKTSITSTGSFQSIQVKPVVDYSTIEEVFVLKKEPDPQLLELLKE